MEPHEYASHDAVGLRQLLVAGAVSGADVEAAARRAIADVNPALNALAGPLFADALDFSADGPLGGVPFLLKDSGPFARGVGFSAGSRAIHGAVASDDHPLMRAFRAAGLAALGRTTAPELGLNFATESLRYGVTRNPWLPTRGVGGSSGGAAALVAAGAVPIAHASDGAGSIRVPASACGLVGLKPGRGIVPGSVGSGFAGSADYSLGYDFVVTRTVRDSAAVLDAVSWPPTASSRLLADPGRVRIALATEAWSGAPVDDEVAAAAADVARTLEWIGHRVSEASPAIEGEAVVEAQLLAVIGAGRTLLRAPVEPNWDALERVSRAAVREATNATTDEIGAMVAAGGGIRQSVDSFFERFDVLVTPTMAVLPPAHGTLDYDGFAGDCRDWLREIFTAGPFTAAFNVSGHPAISVPTGFSRGGLPIGVQLVGAHGRDALLLQLAAQLEQAMPWSGRVPSVYAD